MSRKSNLANDMFSLWFHAPMVIAARCEAMAVSALTGEAQDTTEMTRMIVEKAEASVESAIALNNALAHQGLAMLNTLSVGGEPRFTARQSEDLASAALKPFAKRVRSNNRRLNRGKS